MSKIADSLDNLISHRAFLMGELAKNARAYLETWQRLEAVSPDSDEHGDLLGYALAQAKQLEMDVQDIAEADDKVLEQLPDDDE